MTVCSPKGGTGKTMLARTILVAAARDGLNPIGIDFDHQGSLKKWAERRERTLAAFPDVVPVRVESGELDDWRGALKRVSSYSLAVLDTPPSVEDHLAAINGLCADAACVVVPTSPTDDDLDSVVPWMQGLREAGARATFVLNRANRRTIAFGRSRDALMRAGPVCSVEIPQLEEMHAHAGSGLTVLDIDKARGREAMMSVWTFFRREIGL